MSVLQLNCGVWNRLSDEVQAIFSGKHSIGLVLSEVCKGVLDDRFKLKASCVSCKNREERG